MKTTLAIPVWEGCVSTTLDFARRLLIVVVEGGCEVSRSEIAFSDEPAERKAQKIRDLGVQIVLCGAVSEPLSRAIRLVGLQVVPYVSGPVDYVLGAYLCGRLMEPRFMQPGCRPGARRRYRFRGGRRL